MKMSRSPRTHPNSRAKKAKIEQRFFLAGTSDLTGRRSAVLDLGTRTDRCGCRSWLFGQLKRYLVFWWDGGLFRRRPGAYLDEVLVPFLRCEYPKSVVLIKDMAVDV